MQSKRLTAIKQLVPRCDLVLDIGTDHAMLPILLIKENKANFVIASDIARPPLVKAAKNVSKNSLDNFIDLRLGDGLQVLDNEMPSVIILAGMGGLKIIDILSVRKKLWKGNSELVIQPQTEFFELRKYLIEQKYIFNDELLVKESDKFYQVMHLIPDYSLKNDKINRITTSYSVLELEYGPILLYKDTPEVIEYLQGELSKTKTILTNINKSRQQVDKSKKVFMEKKLKGLLEVLNIESSH